MRDWRHDCLSCDILRTGFQVLSFAWLEVLTGAMAAALLVRITKYYNLDILDILCLLLV